MSFDFQSDAMRLRGSDSEERWMRYVRYTSSDCAAQLEEALVVCVVWLRGGDVARHAQRAKS